MTCSITIDTTIDKVTYQVANCCRDACQRAHRHRPGERASPGCPQKPQLLTSLTKRQLQQVWAQMQMRMFDVQMGTCVGLLIGLLIVLGVNAVGAPLYNDRFTAHTQSAQYVQGDLCVLSLPLLSAGALIRATVCPHQPRSFGSWNANGSCTLPDPSLSYQQCAALGQGATNLTKAAFTYTNATCGYPSECRRQRK